MQAKLTGPIEAGSEPLRQGLDILGLIVPSGDAPASAFTRNPAACDLGSSVTGGQRDVLLFQPARFGELIEGDDDHQNQTDDNLLDI